MGVWQQNSFWGLISGISGMFLCSCTIFFPTKCLFYKTELFLNFMWQKTVWWWSKGKWHLTHWRKEAKAGFGRVKSSCSCRTPSSWFPLHFYYYNFCMTVAGPLITFPFCKLKEKLLAAVRQETLLPQAQQCLIKISGHRLKQNDLKVQK